MRPLTHERLSAIGGVPQWRDNPLLGAIGYAYFGKHAVTPSGDLLLALTTASGSASTYGFCVMTPERELRPAANFPSANSGQLFRCLDLGVCLGEPSGNLYITRDSGESWQAMGMEDSAGNPTTLTSGQAVHNRETFIDLGNITWTPSGGSEITRHVAMYAEYNGSSDSSRLFCRILDWQSGDPWPQDGATGESVWHEIMSPSAESIDHWHGGHCVRVLSTAGVEKTVLLLMAGDTEDRTGVMVCDDLADLLEDPDTWKTRWGLDIGGESRRALLNGSSSGTYVVDFITNGVATSNCHQTARWGTLVHEPSLGMSFTIPDADLPSAPAQSVLRIDLRQPVYRAEALAGGTIGGLGLSSIYVPGSPGVPVIALRDKPGRGGSDGYCRIVAIDPGGESWRILREWRSDTGVDVACGVDWWAGGVLVHFGASSGQGYVYDTSYSPHTLQDFDMGTVELRPSAIALPNWARNPLLPHTGQMDAWTGGNTAPPEWVKSGTLSAETGWREVDGRMAAVIARSSGTSDGIELRMVDDAARRAIAHKFVRVSMEVYCPVEMLKDHTLRLVAQYVTSGPVIEWNYGGTQNVTARPGWWTWNRIVPVLHDPGEMSATYGLVIYVKMTSNPSGTGASFALRNVQITPALVDLPEWSPSGLGKW
jgi:hypothetical protein